MTKQTSHDQGLTLLLLACFLIGSAAGAGFARWGVTFAWYLLEAGGENICESAGFFQAWLLALRYPLFLYFCGFTRHGRLLIPPAMLCRGFFMSYTIAALRASFGDAGFFLAFALLLCHGIGMLPLCFLTASYSWRRSEARGRWLRRDEKKKGDVLLAAILAAAAGVSALLECTLLPRVLEWLLALFRQ